MRIIADDINSGDSRESVIEKLGPGVVLASDDPRRRAYFANPPSNLPDGLQTSDMLVTYGSSEGIGMTLHFRNDKLINFTLPDAARQAMRQQWER